MTPKKTRRALGRGLSNLIPVSDERNNVESEVLEIAINTIQANPYQPRRTFHDEDIRGLAERIQSQGLLQPIILRKKGEGHEIVSGERRLRALKYLNFTKAPCIIKARVSDTKMLEMALVENIQRENLNDLEVAESYQKLLLKCGLSHKELSEQVGKSRSVVTNTLRLLKLPKKVQELVFAGKISSGHARALLSINESAAQIALAEKIVLQSLTVREVERIAQAGGRKKKGGKASSKGASVKEPEILHQEEQLRYHFGTDVKIVARKSDKGKVEIYYYTRDDLNRVLDILMP